jgi:hypothetical protein
MSEPIMEQLAVVDDASKCHGILDLRTIRAVVRGRPIRHRNRVDAVDGNSLV